MIKVGSTIVIEFTTSDPITGAATDADSLPTGVVTRNGVDNAAIVTIANKATGEYTATFTLDVGNSFADQDVVALVITATISTVVSKAVVWQDTLSTVMLSELSAAIWAAEITELAALPGASPQAKEAFALLYMALRNEEVVTAVTKVIKNFAGVAVGTSPLSDDGTTFTKGKLA